MATVTTRKRYILDMDQGEANDVAQALRERGSQLGNGATITLSNGHQIQSRQDIQTADRLTTIARQLEGEDIDGEYQF
jgi:hypothetical protein